MAQTLADHYKDLNIRVIVSPEKGGVIGIVNRGGVDAKKLEADNFSWLLSLDLPSYKPEECPLCEKGVNIDTTLGHGK